MGKRDLLKDGNKNLKKIIASLQNRLGRVPTEEEVIRFINGNLAEKERIWNSISTPTSETP